jgi:protein-L-isoaspartate(D-aspartate) O-methyltransferase
MYDQLELSHGAHVVHVGAGTGYYSAILAEIVGRAGRVTAIEIDPALASRATENLSTMWPQTTVVTADGFAFRPDQPADTIIVNAGVTHFSSAWLDTLAAENGRLLVPLTNTGKVGRLLAGHPAGRQFAALPRAVRWPGRDDSVHWRARCGGGSKIECGAGEFGFRRYPIAAART